MLGAFGSVTDGKSCSARCVPTHAMCVARSSCATNIWAGSRFKKIGVGRYPGLRADH